MPHAKKTDPKNEKKTPEVSESNQVIQDTLGKLIKLSNSPNRDMTQYGPLLKTLIESSYSIKPITAPSSGALSAWETKVLLVITEDLLQFGMAKEDLLKPGAIIALGIITKVADAKYGMGFSAASLCVDLLTRRGLVESLTKGRLSELARSESPKSATEGLSDSEAKEPSGFLMITKVGAKCAMLMANKKQNLRDF